MNLDTFLHILTDIFWVRENIAVILSVLKTAGVKIMPAFGANRSYFISNHYPLEIRQFDSMIYNN